MVKEMSPVSIAELLAAYNTARQRRHLPLHTVNQQRVTLTDIKSVSQATATALRKDLWRLGHDCDSAIAQRCRVSPIAVLVVRLLLHVPHAEQDHDAIKPALINRVGRYLQAGRAKPWVSKSTRLPARTVSHIATVIGWDITWKARSRTIGTLSRERMIALYNKGQTLEAIAHVAGVSRQRIQQAVAAEGCAPRMPLIKERGRERQAQQALRRAQRPQRQEAKRARQLAALTTFLKPAQQRWERGWTIARIAKHYDVPLNSMGWHIHAGRQQLNWFQQTTERRAQRLAAFAQSLQPMHRAWERGWTIARMAQHCHVSSPTMWSWICKARKQLNWFQPTEMRQQLQAKEHRITLEAMHRAWVRGWTIARMANHFHIPVNDMTSRISKWRQQYNIFPPRSS